MRVYLYVEEAEKWHDAMVAILEEFNQKQEQETCEERKKMSLYEEYCSNEMYHINNSSDIFQKVFEDALRMQGDRVVNNIMMAFFGGGMKKL